MPVTARYTPIAPGDTDETLSFDFSPLLVAGEILTGGVLTVATNTTPPVASTALVVNGVFVGVGAAGAGSALIASVTASQTGGGDQLLTFTAATTLRPSLSRTALIFVGATS